MHTATKWFTDAGLWRFECKQGDYKQDGSANWRESTRLFREHRRAVGEHPYEPGVNLTTTVTVEQAAALDALLARSGASRSAFLRDAVRFVLGEASVPDLAALRDALNRDLGSR